MAVYLPLDGSDFAPNIIMLNEERQRFWEAWTVLYIHPPQLNIGPGSYIILYIISYIIIMLRD